MSNVEAIKKAFAEFTTLNIDFTPDSSVSNAVISPTDGYRGTYFTVIGAGDQQNDVANLFTLAVNSVPELLTTLEALRRENEVLKIERDDMRAKAISNAQERNEAERYVRVLSSALSAISLLSNDRGVPSADIVRQMASEARTALASAGEEHHAE